MQNMEICQFDHGQNIAVEYKSAVKNVIILELLIWWGPLLLQCYVSWKSFSSLKLLKEDPNVFG